MYASPVPLLVVRSDADALVEVNGHSLGECGPAAYAAMPVSDTGDYYISLRPLVPGAQARLRKLSFENGGLRMPEADDVSARVWPGGVVEVHIRTKEAESGAEPPPRTLAETRFGPYRLRLLALGDMQLYAERDGRPFCSYRLGPFMDGVFEAHPPYLALLLRGGARRGAEERLLLFDAQLQSALDLEGVRVSLEDGPTCIERLPTLLGHERRTRYLRRDAGKGFAAQRSETGFFTRAAPQPADAQSIAVAFFEAVREGFAEEAMSYLSPRLQESFRFPDIAAFLGGFGGVYTPPSEPGGEWIGLGEGRDARLQSLRLYRLSFEAGKIDNISEEA